jgi:hypothetical protein
MAIRIISFCAGALLGAGSAAFTFYISHSDIRWSIVSLAALTMGVLAFVFGRLFWEHFGDLLP